MVQGARRARLVLLLRQGSIGRPLA
ncbi:hypothetical protein ID866_10555 [Astraeus odoratus]|nr:hypothetical protein ID866_10555 [Astraeus odoratus]